MTLRRARKSITRTNLLLTAGVVATALVMAFGANVASADLPSALRVYVDSFDKEGTRYFPNEFTPVEREYEMKQKNRSTQNWKVTGVPLLEVVSKKLTPEQLAAMNFVKLTFSDGAKDFVIVEKSLLTNDPPVVVTSKVRNVADETPSGAKSPAIVYPSTSKTKYNRELTREVKNDLVNITAASGSVLTTGINKSKKGKDGSYKFTPKKKPSGHGSVSYQWYLLRETRSGNEIVDQGTKSSFKTTALADSTSKFEVRLYVTTGDQSASISAVGVSGSKSNDQKTTPPPKQPATTTPTTPSPAAPGSPFGGGATNGTGTYTPPKYNAPKTTIPPVSSAPGPTAGTSTADESGLSDAVAGLRGIGTARAVSGVMLSTPATTSNPAEGGSEGQALERLAGPLASAANDVFQPINDTQDLWRFMLAVMFATGIFGGIREYRKP